MLAGASIDRAAKDLDRQASPVWRRADRLGLRWPRRRRPHWRLGPGGAKVARAVAAPVTVERMKQDVTDSMVANPGWDDPSLEQWRVSYGHTDKERERLAIAISRAEELAYWNAEMALIDARIALHETGGDLAAFVALDKSMGLGLGRGPGPLRAAAGYEPETDEA